MATQISTHPRKRVLELLRDIAGLGPNEIGRIRGRVEALLRRGVVPGANTGRGKRAGYTPEMVWQLALTFELGRLGVTPEAATELWNKTKADILRGVRQERGSVFLPLVPGRTSGINLDLDGLRKLVSYHLEVEDEA